MFRLQCVVFICLVATLPAWAGSAGVPSGALTGGQPASSLPPIRQRLKQDRIEVKRLQQSVARQESDSQRASQRLQQQDQAIAELRRQLQELQAGPAAGHHP